MCLCFHCGFVLLISDSVVFEPVAWGMDFVGGPIYRPLQNPFPKLFSKAKTFFFKKRSKETNTTLTKIANMSFLDRLRQSQQTNDNWKILNEVSQLDQILQDSFQKPVILFKHSTTCGISAGAKHRLETEWEINPEEVDFYYLDLLTYRPISNLIAEKLGVRHESPQIILVKNGEAVADTSHHAISGNVVSGWLIS